MLPRASNGPNHLGPRALQVAHPTNMGVFDSTAGRSTIDEPYKPPPIAVAAERSPAAGSRIRTVWKPTRRPAAETSALGGAGFFGEQVRSNNQPQVSHAYTAKWTDITCLTCR